jgi:hypothetical protein
MIRIAHGKQLDGHVEGGCTNHALYVFRSGQRSNFSKALNPLVLRHRGLVAK